MTPFRLARLDLLRHPAASLLAVLSLALCVACAGMLLRAWRLADSRFATLARAGDAIVGAKADPMDMALGALNLEGPYPGFIPLRMAVLINNHWLEKEFSVGVTPLVFCGRYNGRRVIGATADILDMRETAGFAIAEGEWPNTEAGLALGSETATREKLRVGDTVRVGAWASDSADSPARTRRMRVAGILKPMGNAWDGALFTNIIQAQALLGRIDMRAPNGGADNWVAHYLVLSVPPGGMEHVETIINQRTVAQVASIPATIATLERLTAAGRALGVAAALLALCLAAAAIAAVLLGRFEAQSRQMAALEAIGYARRELVAMLVWQGALLGSAAVACGAAMEAAAFPLLRRALASALPAGAGHSPLSPASSLPVWCAAFALTIAASALSSLFIFRKRADERLRELA